MTIIVKFMVSQMLITLKKHKVIIGREKLIRGELALLVIAIYRIAIQWKAGKMGNIRAISLIHDLLDSNKEGIFKYRYEDPENRVIDDREDPDLKLILNDV